VSPLLLAVAPELDRLAASGADVSWRVVAACWAGYVAYLALMVLGS
jgi:hypothetical protein